MRRLFFAAITLGIMLAPAAATFAAADAAASAPPRHVVHHRPDFARARAYASATPILLAPLPRIPETDGLSRNDEDCNYGCIDH